MKITDEAVNAALNAWVSESTPNSDMVEDMRASLTAALPHLQAGVDVTSLDLSILEKLSEKADEFDIPDDFGPWPDIQDAMITAGDLRKVRKFLQDFRALSSKPVDVAVVRRQALDEAADICDQSAALSQEQHDKAESHSYIKATLKGEIVAAKVLAGRIRSLSSEPAKGATNPADVAAVLNSAALIIEGRSTAANSNFIKSLVGKNENEIAEIIAKHDAKLGAEIRALSAAPTTEAEV